MYSPFAIALALAYVLCSAQAGPSDGSRCTLTDKNITCSYQSFEMPNAKRMVYFQVPVTPPPAEGYPVVLMFQGSFFGPKTTWQAHEGMVFGAFYQTQVVKTLLDAGFAVLTPAAPLDLFWQTNIPPYDVHWQNCSDDLFMLEILAALNATNGPFGRCDPDHVFATGISSGGYMTSRMGVSLTSRFRALVVESGSYCICGGPACVVPPCGGGIPVRHPPTLFLHGLVDPVVPYYTMKEYHSALEKQNTSTGIVTCDTCTHQWIPQAPASVLPWFQRFFNWTYEGDGYCP